MAATAVTLSTPVGYIQMMKDVVSQVVGTVMKVFLPLGGVSAYHIVIETTATVLIEGSYDGAVYFTLVSAKTATCSGTLNPTPFMRATTSAWTGGKVNVFVGVQGKTVYA